jgi:hypothetical protein
MRVTIHQPQFFPWLGYLDKIDQADLFVLLDTVQYKKNEWQNRNRIRTAQGWQWLTVPVHYKFGQRIKDIHIEETSDWRARHLRAISLHYGKAPYRERLLEGLREVYLARSAELVMMNLQTIRWLLEGFGITTPVRLASEMDLREEPTERLIDICQTVGATHYLAGAGAQAYLDVGRFEASGVELEIQEFQHPVYSQCYEPFIPGMSAMDLLLNCGSDALTCLRQARCAPMPASKI